MAASQYPEKDTKELPLPALSASPRFAFLANRRLGIGWLFAAILVPGLLAASILFYEIYNSQKALLEQGTLQTARAISSAIDRDLASIAGKLQVLANDPSLRTGDFQTFYRQASAALATEHLAQAITVIDQNGQQVLNTHRPYGAALPKTGHPEMVDCIFKTALPCVSNLFTGAVRRSPFVALSVPVSRDGKVVYALVMGIAAERLNELLLSQQLAEGWMAALIDSRGIIVARTQKSAQYIGEPATPDLLDSMGRDRQGTLATHTLEGTPAFIAFTRSELSGWTMAVAAEQTVLYGKLYRPLGSAGIALVTFLFIGSILAWVFSHHLRDALQRLRTATAAGTAGDLEARAPLSGPREIAELAKQFNELQEARRLAEENLRQSQQFSDDIINSLPGVFYMLDTEERYVRWNRKQCEVTGYGPDEMLQMHALHVFDPRTASLVREWISEVFKYGESTVEASLLTKDGRKIPYYFTGQLTKIGRQQYLVGLGIDITERQLAEEARRRAETRLQRLFDVNPVGMVIGNEQGYALEANDHFLEIIGRTREELGAVALNWRDITPPEWMPSAERAWTELWERGVCTPFEKEFFRSDGSRCPVYITAATLPEEPGKIIALVENISDRKRTEKKIEDLNAALERRVEERTAALVAANRELEAFTFATSHDLRGPLGRIGSFSTLLERQYRDRLEGNGLLYLEFIRQNSNRLSQLVDDLLQHARIAHQDLELKPVDLLTRVLVVLEESAEEIRITKASVRLDVPPARVLADPQALTQAVSNLVQNALKYSAATTSPIIEIGGEVGDTSVLLWVRDNGIGFDMAYHDKIFQIFRRLHTYKEYEGSGVGLALVKRAMERMGGRVWAESEPGQGSTFFLEFRTTA